MSSKAPSHSTESIADRKKSRELAEARQSGAVAPAVDAKTGHMINPHNPEFLTKRPWYLGGDGDAGPSLEHQAGVLPEQNELTLAEADRLLREKQQKDSSKKLRVGMWVEALKHNKKPYRICQVVKKKGKEYDLQYEDGTIERRIKKSRIRITKSGNRTYDGGDKKETYDSKRDKYHGYDPDKHMKKTQAIYNKREELRRQQRVSKQKEEKTKDHASDSDFDDSDVGSDESEDEFVQRDEDAKTFTSRLARQGGVGGAQMKVTARNLRIREDTAKYLRNLDPTSAYYDPKSRSMRDNPNPEVEEQDFRGDNFARISGDAVGLAGTQLFAWEASQKGVGEIHPQANPSQAELLQKQFKTKSADLKAQQKKAVLDKYGGSEYLDGADGLASAVGGQDDEDKTTKAAERKTRFGVSVTEEEYAPDGRLIKGGVTAKPVALKSKYEEDVFINGHTTVWGSYFHRGAFRWGYADDHSLLKNSYCTGENGRRANDEANEMRYGTGTAGSAALAQAREMLKSIPTAERKAGGVAPGATSKLYGEADQTASFDKDKVREALKKVDREKAADGDRKRKYNSMDAEVDVTEEEMEAYRLRKERSMDPMAKLADSDELLDYK